MIRYGITPWAGKSLINMNFRCTPEDAKDIANRFDVISNYRKGGEVHITC